MRRKSKPVTKKFLTKESLYGTYDALNNRYCFGEKSEPKKVASITFTLQSQDEIVRGGEIQISSPGMYDQHSEPLTDGVLDKRLGISSRKGICATCGSDQNTCPGHFGYILLELPVFHLGYYKQLHNTLSSICNICSRVLLSKSEKTRIVKKYKRTDLDILSKRELQKKTVEKCKKVKTCPNCGAGVGQVKKITAATFQLLRKYIKSYYDSDSDNEETELEAKVTNDDSLDPKRVYKLLCDIPSEDLPVLWFDATLSRPENMLLSAIPVPPVALRPSVTVDKGVTNEDDLTMRLRDIVSLNNDLRNHLALGKAGAAAVKDTWDDLQNIVASYINSEHNYGMRPGDRAKPTRGLVQRLKGKRGRFRGNLSGKRVDFTGRTVISPDPNLKISQVGVPKPMAMILTFPDFVNKINLEFLKKLVVNGAKRYPGARFIHCAANDSVKALEYSTSAQRKKIAETLRIGDKVERNLIDGDHVLFNRQPSLHRMSIMCHEVKVLEGRTLRFNECVCAPYNADFDGDEMNLHFPQTIPARTEALELMASTRNILSPRHSEAIISATQDFFTASYVLTQDAHTLFFSYEDMLNVLAIMNNGADEVSLCLPTPCVLKPVRRWSGKQVFSLFVETKLDINSAPIHIVKGKLMCGEIGKNMLGGSKKGIIYELCEKQKQGEYIHAVNFLNCWTRFCSRFLGNVGFTIGINDVTPSSHLEEQKLRIIGRGYAACNEKIAQLENGSLVCLPGCDPEESLESEISGILSKVRDAAGSMCMQQLPSHNQPFIMAKCGSKGSPLNICQMVSCVGQQIVGGKRMPNGFSNRSLPHFEVFSKHPVAKGFVSNSFFSGLQAPEFFFHTMGGREGLVDTAVKTAETGYMARRLMKALEDLVVLYDWTVRSADGGVVQFRYGEDGLSTLKIEKGVNPVDFAKLLRNFSEDTSESSPVEDIEAEVDGILRCQGDLLTNLLKERIVKDIKNNVTTDPSIKLTSNLLEAIVKKYVSGVVEPGEAVGAIAGQSLGEPGTQMTLKTFHFAGVASMNVTLGVPRLKEIINATKNISTPIITVNLVNPYDERSARIIQGRIERTFLSEITEKVDTVVTFDQVYFEFYLNRDTIESLHLEITGENIRKCVLAERKLKKRIGAEDIKYDAQTNRLRVIVPPPTEASKNDAEKQWVMDQSLGKRSRKTRLIQRTVFDCEFLKDLLLNIVVSGIQTVHRAVVNKDENGRSFHLLVEGTGLLTVLGTPGVDGTKSRSNHIFEIEKVLGIEAAREAIMHEVDYIFGRYGLTIDRRHLMLLADVMTYKGEVLGITRQGISKMKESILMLASFEKTAEHLFEASVHANRDEVRGVSECIIVGSNMSIGTGMSSIVTEWRQNDLVLKQRQPLLNYA